MKKLLAIFFSFILLLGFVTPTQAVGSATFTLTPLSAAKKVDNLFSVEVRVNTAGTAVNTMKAYLTFDPQVLEVTSISTTGGSVATIVTENEPDNVNGTIHITGAATGSGFNGATGLFATINLRAKAAGTSTLTFTSDSRIISNADNTDILNFTGLQNGSYTVSGTSSTASNGTGAAGDTTVTSSGSALPSAGSTDGALSLIGFALLLIFGGVFIANPYLFAPRLAKKHQEKTILKKL